MLGGSNSSHHWRRNSHWSKTKLFLWLLMLVEDNRVVSKWWVKQNNDESVSRITVLKIPSKELRVLKEASKTCLNLGYVGKAPPPQGGSRKHF